MALNSMQEIFEKAASRSIPFWRVVLETDMEERQVTEEQSMEKMRAARSVSTCGWHTVISLFRSSKESWGRTCVSAGR